MSEIEITNEDIDAVTDAEVCALADFIVLRNQGCGNASVLIDRFAKQVRLAARKEALQEAATVADGYDTTGSIVPLDYEQGFADGKACAADDIATAIRTLASNQPIERGQ